MRTAVVLLDVRKLVCWFLTMLCVILLICAEFGTTIYNVRILHSTTSSALSSWQLVPFHSF